MDRVRWLDEQETRAWRGLVGATAAIMARVDAELQASHDLSLGDYEVLAVLSHAADGKLRMSDLASALHLSPSGLTRRLDGLVRRRWVARERCETDRRGAYAVLTDDGLAALDAAAPTHLRGVRAHFVDRLTRRQLDNLASALGRVDTAADPVSPSSGWRR